MFVTLEDEVLDLTAVEIKKVFPIFSQEKSDFFRSCYLQIISFSSIEAARQPEAARQQETARGSQTTRGFVFLSCQM